MNTKHFFLALLSLLWIGAFNALPAFSQGRIDRIIRELEEKGVDVNSVVRRNTKTRKVYLEVKDLSFYSKGGNYARQLYDAFEREAPNSVKELRSGKSSYTSCKYTLIFKENKKRAIYTLVISDRSSQPLVKVSVVMHDYSVPGNDDDDDSFIIDGKYFNMDKLKSLKGYKASKLQALNNIDWSDFKKKMETLKNYDWSTFNEKMEDLNIDFGNE